MKTLHLVTRELAPWEEALLAPGVASGEAERLDLPPEGADYDAALRAVFESDAPMVW